ncbi:MAG: hypothetical protein ABS894_00920 [Aerococcus urinaeequi]
MSRSVGIDPSTKTGLVIIENGIVTHQKVLTGIGEEDPKRASTLIDDLSDHIRSDDNITIESPSYNSTGQGVSVQYGIAYMIRDMLYRRRIDYTDVAPSQLKGWVGKGNDGKPEVKANTKRIYGFEHKSGDVIDAFVLAKIAEALQTGVILRAKQQEILMKLTGEWENVGRKRQLEIEKAAKRESKDAEQTKVSDTPCLF